MNATLPPKATCCSTSDGTGCVSPSVLLLGLGNDILCDDAIGLRVAREVRQRLTNSPDVEVRESEEMGLALLDFLVGYREVVIVDAAETGQAEPGFVHRLEVSDLRRLRAGAPHSLGLGEALDLGRALGMDVPQRVSILAVEVEEPRRLTTQLTARLESAFPQIVARVLQEMSKLARDGETSFLSSQGS